MSHSEHQCVPFARNWRLLSPPPPGLHLHPDPRLSLAHFKWSFRHCLSLFKPWSTKVQFWKIVEPSELGTIVLSSAFWAYFRRQRTNSVWLRTIQVSASLVGRMRCCSCQRVLCTSEAKTTLLPTSGLTNMLIDWIQIVQSYSLTSQLDFNVPFLFFQRSTSHERGILHFLSKCQ